jgi:hypothetical protein
MISLTRSPFWAERLSITTWPSRSVGASTRSTYVSKTAAVVAPSTANEGLDLYKPQDRHDVYKALGIKVMVYPNGSIEFTGSLLADPRSDNMGAMPNEEYHALAR